MSRNRHEEHLSRIQDQFSKQAIPFAELSIHMNAIEILKEMSAVGGGDDVLDVACGPGLVACELALYAKRVTGLDITRAMIEQAAERQKRMKLGNVEWKVGNAVPLQFDDDTFSLVITRYSFHHFLEPGKALKEMIRVCKPGGRVLVADVCVAEEHSVAYDRMERMRDDSHVHALTEKELSDMFRSSGLAGLKMSGYGLDTDVESLLDSSSPRADDREKIRDMIIADIGVNNLGINARFEDGDLRFTFPIVVCTGRKP